MFTKRLNEPFFALFLSACFSFISTSPKEKHLIKASSLASVLQPDPYISGCGWKPSGRQTDWHVKSVSVAWPTLIINPEPLNEATVTDNKHIILHVMAVNDLNLHQEDLWWSIWPHPSNMLSVLDRYLWSLLSLTSEALFFFSETLFSDTIKIYRCSFD